MNEARLVDPERLVEAIFTASRGRWPTLLVLHPDDYPHARTIMGVDVHRSKWQEPGVVRCRDEWGLLGEERFA